MEGRWYAIQRREREAAQRATASVAREGVGGGDRRGFGGGAPETRAERVSGRGPLAFKKFVATDSFCTCNWLAILRT